MSNRYWFRQKRFGFGATPITREGWLATLAFLIVVLALDAGIILTARTDLQATAMLIVAVFAVIGLFFWFASTKTEGGWRWRWGRRDRADPG
jgi:hypothetical protein